MSERLSIHKPSICWFVCSVDEILISRVGNNLHFGPLNYEDTPQYNVDKNQEIKQLDEEGAAAPGWKSGACEV